MKRAICPQHVAMVQCFRFLNSETHFDDKALTVLLRVLGQDDREHREKWWTEVRACRRRKQEPLGKCDIEPVLLQSFQPILILFVCDCVYCIMTRIIFELYVDCVSAELSTPLVTVFQTQTEFEYMEFKSIVERVRMGLEEKGMVRIGCLNSKLKLKLI